MPPRRNSRHTFTTASLDESTDELVLNDAEPFRFRAYPDNRTHVVVLEDTLFNLAARYFRGVKRPAGLWWIIMDFQPEPIHDPTLALEPGTVLWIPSLRTVTEEIFSESRRRGS